MSRLVVLSVLSLVGCALEDGEKATSGSSSASSSTRRTAYDAELLAVAATYRDYGRVDDRNRWVPTLCRIDPGRARLSEASRSTPHGGKLFYVYAKLRNDYVDVAREISPVGQVIVKEAWTPEEVSSEELPGRGRLESRPAVGRDGKRYRPGEKQGLFVMMKLDHQAHPDTDEGWVYATLDPSGETIIQAGRISACMGCHRDGTVDRLFGIDA